MQDNDPVWPPPEWHYAEVASEYGLKMRRWNAAKWSVFVMARGPRPGDTRWVSSKLGEAEFVPLVLNEQIVFRNTMFIPPAGTEHRSIQGELGHYRLELEDRYQLRGTPYARSLGTAVTHGCVRLSDDDIEWLFSRRSGLDKRQPVLDPHGPGEAR